MRVKVIGSMDSANVLRGYLQKQGSVALWKEGETPDYTIELVNGSDFVFDSVDCPLERSLFKHVRQLTTKDISIKTDGGVQSDQQIKITFPHSESRAIELGVFRGFADFQQPEPETVLSQPLPSDGSVSFDSRSIVQAILGLYDRLEPSQDIGQLKTLYERLLKEKDALLAEKDTQISLLSSPHAQDDWTAQRKLYEELLSEKHARLAERSSLVPPSSVPDLKPLYDNLLAGKDAVIQAKDAQISQLAAQLADSIARAQNPAGVVIPDYSGVLQEKDARIQDLRARLDRLEAPAAIPPAPLPLWKRLFQ